jgi:hypothetical protein
VAFGHMHILAGRALRRIGILCFGQLPVASAIVVGETDPGRRDCSRSAKLIPVGETDPGRRNRSRTPQRAQ